MSGHTPGPWKLQHLNTEHNGYKDWHTFCVRDGKTNQCLAVVGDVDHATAACNQANAALFAAAPDLLESLKAVLSTLIPGYKAVCAAREAIAKAEGRA